MMFFNISNVLPYSNSKQNRCNFLLRWCVINAQKHISVFKMSTLFSLLVQLKSFSSFPTFLQPLQQQITYLVKSLYIWCLPISRTYQLDRRFIHFCNGLTGISCISTYYSTPGLNRNCFTFELIAL